MSKLNFFNFIAQDWAANTGNSKGRLVMLLFRIANFCSRRRIYFYIGFPYLIIYRLLVEWFLGIEIPWNVRIGSGLKLFHGQALVINKNAIIGYHCTLRHSTTIGNKQLADGTSSASPIIGDYVEVGSNVCIIGPLTIGDGCTIGAGTVVVKDVLPGSLVVGNPGRVILKSTNNEK